MTLVVRVAFITGHCVGRRHCEDMKCKDGGYRQGEALLDVGPEGKGGCGAAGWRRGSFLRMRKKEETV